MKMEFWVSEGGVWGVGMANGGMMGMNVLAPPAGREEADYFGAAVSGGLRALAMAAEQGERAAFTRGQQVGWVSPLRSVGGSGYF